MSIFFSNFPQVLYNFGNEVDQNAFQNISAYVDVIDQAKNNSTLYTKHTILDGDRPDVLSQKLYGQPYYHWTFYLMNDNLREQGWPTSHDKILHKAKRDYPNTTITTRTDLTTITGFFKTGDTIEGRTSGATAKIIHRNLDLGQIVVNNIVGGPFVASELLQMTGTTSTVTVHSISAQHLSAHHYENSSGEVVDIDPTSGPGGLLTEVTFLDRMNNQNDELKQIKIIKPSLINDITNAFREAVSF